MKCSTDSTIFAQTCKVGWSFPKFRIYVFSHKTCSPRWHYCQSFATDVSSRFQRERTQSSAQSRSVNSASPMWTPKSNAIFSSASQRLDKKGLRPANKPASRHVTNSILTRTRQVPGSVIVKVTHNIHYEGWQMCRRWRDVN